jgi:hypothetical protein
LHRKQTNNSTSKTASITIVVEVIMATISRANSGSSSGSSYRGPVVPALSNELVNDDQLFFVTSYSDFDKLGKIDKLKGSMVFDLAG